MHTEQPHTQSDTMFWADMMSRWRTLPPRIRRRMARRAGEQIHGLWRDHVNIAHVPLELTRFLWTGAEPKWIIGEDAMRRMRVMLSHERVRRTLMEWHRATGHALTRMEAALFLNGFLKAEGLEKAVILQFARELEGDGYDQDAQQPTREYARALRTESESSGGPYRGYWAPEPGLSPALLSSETDRAERVATGRPLKKGPRITVFRAFMFGHDTLVKRYDFCSWPERLKYLFRISRGRRAWAVAETFRTLGIPSPHPLGYLEVRKGGLPVRSYVFTAFEAESVNARRWVCCYWRKADKTAKRAFRQALQQALIRLYQARIYHADTKLANLMARPAAGRTVPDLLWIDLECVRFNVSPTAHRIVRNLVQMNGSARNAWVTEDERLEFLREMADHYPFLMQLKNIEKIRRWTLARWHKELRTRCGP